MQRPAALQRMEFLGGLSIVTMAVDFHAQTEAECSIHRKRVPSTLYCLATSCQYQEPRGPDQHALELSAKTFWRLWLRVSGCNRQRHRAQVINQHTRQERDRRIWIDQFGLRAERRIVTRHFRSLLRVGARLVLFQFDDGEQPITGDVDSR